MVDIVEREHPVDTADLERCVRRYWDEADHDDERPLYRALTMNLVAVAPIADESLLRATFQHLLHSNPCVAFLVLLRSGDRPLETSFGTHVAVGRASRTVLLEQVTMRASPGERRKVPNLVRQLLVDDLPTQMFWAGALPADLRLFRDLGALADQVVYDSSLFIEPGRDTERIDALGLPAVDLTWLRLKPWRRTLAEAFEHVSWQAGTPTRAVIRFTDTAGPRAASVRLARWLAERLGATVELLATLDCNAPSFEPCSLELTSGAAHILIEHRWPSPTLRVSTTLEDRCQLPFTTVSRCGTRGDLLAAATDTLSAVGAVPVRS